jgi:hypothetical protein
VTPPLAPAAAFASVSPPVPVWAVREPTAVAAGPQQPVGEAPPDQVQPRITLRSGASSLAVDERQLHLRTWFRSSSIDWAEVQGFEARLDAAGARPAGTGRIVALTADGPVELPGTRRALAELRYVRELLDAYRDQAGRAADRSGQYTSAQHRR